MKNKPEPTRAELLDEIAEKYGTEQLKDGEITIEMMMKKRGWPAMRASRALRKAEANGDLLPSNIRVNDKGRHVLAWARKK